VRARSRMLLAFVGINLALGILTGILAWWWVDAAMRRQAQASANAIGAVLAQSPFPLDQPWVHQWVRALSGHEYTVRSARGEPRGGEVQVSAGDRGWIVIDYRAEAYRAEERRALLGTLALVAAGCLAFALASWRVAKHLAGPVEALARAARTIGRGDLSTAVAPAGSGEVLDLARELEHMRVRLHELGEHSRQSERLRTLGTFTATIAHEIRNPLSAIRLSAQMLGRRLPHDPAIALVLDETERLDLIVDELLGFSKGMQAILAPCDLRGAAQAAARLLARQAEHAQVAVAVAGDGWALADSARIRQMLINLLLNAIQAQHGGGAVRILIRPDGLAVEDDGPGVPAPLVPTLFTAFASSRDGGTGLGLHLARAVADAHRAQLTYEPRDPRGARFVLSGLVPCAAAAPAPSSAPVPAQPKSDARERA
jgi:signal transduction histidine kinase